MFQFVIYIIIFAWYVTLNTDNNQAQLGFVFLLYTPYLLGYSGLPMNVSFQLVIFIIVFI